MAFEIARVHGLIRSNIGEDGMPLSFSHGINDSRFREHYHFPASELNINSSAQWSETCSPIETSPCTTETESDEDEELLAGLAERIACSMLLDDDEAAGNAFMGKHSMPNGTDNFQSPVCVSPPSSWTAVGSWPSSAGSSEHSSRVSSQMSSPPRTPVSPENHAWDLLYEAAGEVVRQKINNERKVMSLQARVQQYQAQQAQQTAQAQKWAQHQQLSLQNQQQQSLLNQTHFAAVGYASPKTLQRSFPVSGTGVCSSMSSPMSPRGRFAPEFPQMQRSPSSSPKEHVNQSRQSKGGQIGGGWARQSRPQGSQVHQQASRLGGNGKSSTSNNHRTGRSINCNSPHRHQVPAVNGGSGMRAVFLGGNGTGRESGGTGVFLPRTVGGGSESKRKPACSTVLLPTRIVQVLNLNVEDMRPNPTSPCSPVMHNNNLRPDCSVLSPPAYAYPSVAPPVATPKMCHEESWASAYRKLHPSMLRQLPPSELCLPTEWTY